MSHVRSSAENVVFSSPVIMWDINGAPPPSPDDYLAWRQLALDATARHRNELTSGGWEPDGEAILGPGTLRVVVARHAGIGYEHVDYGFELNRDRADVPVVWDCASGAGSALADAIDYAARMWVTSTAVVVLEMLHHDGRFAEHYQATDPDGLPGWHAIHGPIIGFGAGSGSEAMQQWVIDHPLLPQLAEPLLAAFDRPNINGLKILFGGDIAEVRINGSADPAASAGLASLLWPRTDPPGFIRCFVLAIHPANE